jgi:acyl-CoA thioesterase FadM
LFGDELTINLKLDNTKAMSRWTMVHELWQKNHVLTAIITVDGVLLDTGLRKLAMPPEFFKAAFERIRRTEVFELTENK